jgi:hypothetical protein
MDKNPIRSASRHALIALSLLAFARVSIAQAQQPTRDLTPFKLTVSGTATPAGIIPVDPPLMTGIMMLKGTSDLLGGAITFTDTHLFHIGVDGTPLRSTNGNGAFVGPSGDALFVNWDAVARPTDNPDFLQGIGAFTIRGGAGKFAGVVGSGFFNSRLNVKTFEVTQTWEGLIAQPKK